MRLTSRQRLVALSALAAAAAACANDIPTEKVGGTEYGLDLLAVSPLRPPVASFTARRSGTGNVVLDSLTVTLTKLQPLAGDAAYRFYAVGNAGAGDTVPVEARMTLVHRDSTVTETGTIAVTRTATDLGTSSFFKGVGFADSLIARFGGAQFAGGNKRFLVVTIQANQASPSFTADTPRPLWIRYRDTTVATTGTPPVTTVSPGAVVLSGTSQFGTFAIGRPAYVFVGGGFGRSGFWDRYADGRLLYSAFVQNLSQPPLGYYYQPWMIDSVSRRNVPFGELRSSAYGASLMEYDERPIGTEVAKLPDARFGTSQEEVGSPLQTFAAVHLMLEPKLGDRSLALTSVVAGTLGDTLRVGRGSGALRILALSGADSVAGVTVVAFAEGGRAPLASATTAGPVPVAQLKGQATLQPIPAGNIDLYVTPPGGATLPVKRVVMVARDTMQVVVQIPAGTAAP